MKSMKKKYCYIATYKLPANSIWQKYPIQDVFPNNEGLVSIFKTDHYKLLAKIEVDGKIDSVIYELDAEEKFHNDDFHKFKTEALEVIIKSLNRMQIAFIGLQNQNWHYTAETKNNWTISTSILDYETGTKSLILGFDMRQDFIMNCYISQDPPITLQSIFKVLEVKNNNIDQYINRFLSLKSLSTDPVLHLISLFSLYEYINKYDKSFKSLFNTAIAGKSIEVDGKVVKLTFFDKFNCTRHLVAHGLLNSPKILDTLKQFLKSDSSGNLPPFDRYNRDHINLINEVIGETQTIIQRYLNIDQYINRFLSLKSLSTDPVLHLISLFSLYEYINKYDESLKSLFNTEIAGKSIEVKGKVVKLTFFDKFNCTRNLVAHGLLNSPKTLDTLKQFLKSDSSGNLLLFDRYNRDHINLINEVIGEAQTIIQRYLREQLGVHKLP